MISNEQLEMLLAATNQFIVTFQQIRTVLTKYETPKPDLPPPQPQYKSRKDAAKYLGISTTTLWRLCKQGKISSYQVGGKVMFKTSGLDNFITKNQKQWKA